MVLEDIMGVLNVNKGILLHKCNRLDINLVLVKFFRVLLVLKGYKP